MFITLPEIYLRDLIHNTVRNIEVRCGSIDVIVPDAAGSIIYVGQEKFLIQMTPLEIRNLMDSGS